MITEYGRVLRKIRIDKGEVLRDMAEKLQMTSSYLSAIECGKRKIPDSMTEKIVGLYNLNQDERIELEDAMQKSLKSIQINLSNIDEEKQELALKFARTFEDIDNETIAKIKELLVKKE